MTIVIETPDESDVIAIEAFKNEAVASSVLDSQPVANAPRCGKVVVKVEQPYAVQLELGQQVSDGGGGLSDGAVAAIVIGVVAIVCCCLGCFIGYLRRKRNQKKKTQSDAKPEKEPFLQADPTDALAKLKSMHSATPASQARFQSARSTPGQQKSAITFRF